MNISQNAVGSMWFYRFHRILHSSTTKEFIPIAIALTTGIPISHFFGKYWHEFITKEVNGRYANPKVLYRNELHILPWIVVDLIKRVYQSNNLPFDKKITADFEWDLFIYKKLLQGYFPQNHLSDFNLDFSRYPQIIFGRQILIRNGYTNEVGKFLKSMFGIRLNKELENFLLIEDLSKCHLKLASIDLHCPDDLFLFKDNEYRNKSDYYNFLALDEYLKQCLLKTKNTHSRSIYVLIVLCLFNGLRPAFFKDLRWKEFLEINEDDRTFKIHSEFTYRGRIILIPKDYAIEIYKLCPICHPIKITGNLDTFKPYFEKTILNYTLTNPNVFISAKGGPLMLQSLKRDIQKTLKNLGFDYWNKVSTLSFQKMWGRRILEINGDHKPTIRELKKHFNLKSKKELFLFLDVFKSRNETSTFMNKKREKYSDYINYSMEFYIQRFGK